MQKISDLKNELKKLVEPNQATKLQGYFKTGKGQYGEGDTFLGIKVPILRRVSKGFTNLKLKEVEKLLHSKIHEHRLVALFILTNKFYSGDRDQKKEIFNLYIKNAKFVNNWDLVDLSAPKISGPYLLDKDRKILYKLAKSKNLWEKRIAIMSTCTFIINNDFMDTFNISEILLNDKHDLIHKAVGWMLREIGNKDIKEEEKFLDKYALRMPRTMLRYAIEKFPEKKRLYYLKLR